MNLAHPEQVGFSAQRLERIHPAMQRYIDQGQLAGMVTLVARQGKVAHFETHGWQDLEARKPMPPDAIFRIFSMTKPITTVALMMLYEEGCFRLTDPISRYLPVFKDKEMKVISGQGENGVAFADLARPINIHDLLTHTAGMSYGFDENDYLDQQYREKVWKQMEQNPGTTLAEMIGAAAQLPLRFQPGTGYHYSLAIDVLGCLVQELAGQPFEDFLQQRIFEPLGMADTGFYLPKEKGPRLANTYGPAETGGLKAIHTPANPGNYFKPPAPSGGGGLLSTTQDYFRFAQMFLNGGEYEGARLLGRKTVEMMTRNRLPKGLFLDPDGAVGFGLGGYVVVNPGRHMIPSSEGNWGWGGAANTKFWVDFKEQMIGILMLQYMPSDQYPVEPDFQTVVYSALIR